MKKIIYFEDVFGWAGIETFMTNVVQNIDNNKYRIEFMLIEKRTNHYDEFLKRNNVKVNVVLNCKAKNPIIRLIKGLYGFNMYLKNHYDADAIHFNISNSVDMIYVYLAKKNGVKIRIAHSHNSFAKSRSRKMLHFFLRPIFISTPSHYMSCSKKAAQWLFGKNIARDEKYYMIKNAIDTKKYLYDYNKKIKIRNKYNLKGVSVFGHVGRFNVQKNHKFLIDIFEQILMIKPNSVLLLIGEGELKQEIENYVKIKKMKEQVRFLGTVSNVDEILSAIDVMILPSLYEGLPFVLVESQAASLPAIVSNTITKEVCVSKYIQYESLDSSPNQWAKNAVELLKCKRTSNYDVMVKNGFDISSMIHELSNIYDKIV